MRKRLNLHHLSPGTILVRSALICALLALIVFGMNYKRIEPIPINRSPLLFNAQNAFRQMYTLSKNFPNRVTWGENRVKAGAWIKKELKQLGYTPKSLNFSEVIAGQQYTDLENIYVEKKGTTHPDEIIVAMAHYDITDTTVEGAMDDASGVGVVLELARIFSKESTDRTVIFLLTDSEEFGAFWGARAFAHSFPQAHQIVAALNFDFITPEKQTKILTLCDGLKTGFTPLWLREIALNSLRSLGSVQALDLDGPMEFIERAMQIPPADHGAFLAAGIPAFNWVGQTDNFPYIMAHYHHTRYDVAEAMRPESFDPYGKGAERVIRTINSLPRIPDEFRDSSYWKLSEHYYLPGWAVTLLHILAFIPFIAYSVTKFGRAIQSSTRKTVRVTFQNEAKVMGILLGSLLLGYALILLLPALRIITLYETFPATQKSLLLYSPNFLAILMVIVAIIGIYFIFKRVFLKPRDAEGYPEIRQALHTGFLAFIIFLAFLKNSYLAVLLLLPPAYFWTAIRARRHTQGRFMNSFLLIGGAITFLATAILLSSVFHVGVVYWYLFLATAYGLISAYSVVLFFMALTVMIRLFRSFVL
jgi:hypothetical protein